MPYYRLAAEEMSYHLTQGDTGQAAKEAIEKGDYKYFREPVRLILGKSLVGGEIKGDVFEGVQPGPIPFSPARAYQPPVRNGLSIELGGPWAFYRDFWRVHQLHQLAGMLPGPEVSIGPGQQIHAPIVIHNGTGQPAEVTLTATSPPSWKELIGTARYSVGAHDEYPLYFVLEAPRNAAPGWYDATFQAKAGGSPVGLIKLRVNIGSGGLPQ
jgi:hypothetical protein